MVKYYSQISKILATFPNVFDNNNNNRQKTDANNSNNDDNDNNNNNDIIKTNHFTFTKKIRLSSIVTALLLATLLISTSAISIPVYGQTLQNNKLKLTTQVICDAGTSSCPSASQITLTIRRDNTDLNSTKGNSSGVDVNLSDGSFYVNWNAPIPNGLKLYPAQSPHCIGIIGGGQSLTCTQLMVYTSSVDTDKDGIPDSWETNGIPYNGTDGVLQHYQIKEGNPHRTHLYVEVDYMKDHKPIYGNTDFGSALGNVRKSFRNAEVSDPDGSKGISLYTDLGEEIPHEETTTMQDLLFRIRPEWFGTAAERADPNHDAMLAAKAIVYHYAIFAHQQPGTSSSGLGQRPGMNFFVTLGAPNWPKDNATGHNVGSLDQQQGTFMHELGHNLGLQHGGGDQVNCKPNYFSVMSYLFQFSNPVATRPLDYSRSALNNLTKTNLNEPTGMTESIPPNLTTAYGPKLEGKPQAFAFANGSALDWNQNGIKTDPAVNADINSNFGTCQGSGGGPNLNGFNDWLNIIYIPDIYPRQQQAGSQQAGSQQAQVASGSPVQGFELPKEPTAEDVIRSNLVLLQGVNDAIGEIKSGQTAGQVNQIKQTAFEVQNLIGVLKTQQPSPPSPTAGAATGTPLTATTAPGSAAMPTTATSSSLPPEVVALMQKPTGGMSVDTNHVGQLIKTGELGTAIGELDKLLAEVSTLVSPQSQSQQQLQPPSSQQQLQPPSSQQQLQPQQQLQTPMANAGVSQTVEANATVMLDGRNSQPAKPGTTITAYQWTQLPTQGAVPVNLIGGPNIPTPMFIAPTLPYPTTLAFSLRVMASDGSVSTNDAVVHVMVNSAPMTTALAGGGALGAFQQPPSQLQPQQQPLQQQPILPPQQQQQQPLSPNLQQQPNLPSATTTP